MFIKRKEMDMAGKRKKYTAEEKVRILRLHLVERRAVSDNRRLHSAIGYITPNDKLLGRAETILAQRDAKLAAAREARKAKRKAS